MEGAYREVVKRVLAPLSESPGFNGVEVGVAEGKTSELLLCTYPQLSLCCVDPWEGGRPADDEYVRSGDTQGTWTVRQKDDQFIRCVRRLNFAAGRVKFHNVPSSEGVGYVPDNSVHFVFIDAVHTEEHVAADSSLWLPKLKKGGVMIWHDYDSPKYTGVGIAVRRFVNALDLPWHCESGVCLAWAFKT